MARAEKVEEVHRRRLELQAALAGMAIGRTPTSDERAVLALVLRRVSALEHRDLRDPLLSEVVAGLDELTDDDARALWYRNAQDLRDEIRPVRNGLADFLSGALGGIFDGPTTFPLQFEAPLQTVDISRLEARGEAAIAAVLACLSSWGQAAIDREEDRSVSRLVVRDEVWRHMRYRWMVGKIDSDLRLSRAQGVVNMLITHELGDFDAAADPETARLLAAKCSMRVTFAQNISPDSPIARTLELNRTECEMVSGWTAGAVGRGLWRIGPRRGYVVRADLSAWERELTFTNERMRA
jgi:hypothetical protein